MKRILAFLPTILVALSMFGGIFALPAVTFADGQSVAVNCSDISSQSNQSVNPVCTADLSHLIGVVITIIFIIAILLALFFLIFGGLKWILSGGSKEGTESARKMITAAIIGLAIVFLSFIIITILGKIFNFSITNLTIPSLSNLGGSGSTTANQTGGAGGGSNYFTPS